MKYLFIYSLSLRTHFYINCTIFYYLWKTNKCNENNNLYFKKKSNAYKAYQAKLYFYLFYNYSFYLEMLFYLGCFYLVLLYR